MRRVLYTSSSSGAILRAHWRPRPTARLGWTEELAEPLPVAIGTVPTAPSPAAEAVRVSD